MDDCATKNELSWDYTTGSVFKFALPSIVLVVFMSLYQAVDGFFLAHYVDSDAIAAVNIAYPLIGVFYALSLMVASGGVAVVAAKLGEDKQQEAGRISSMVLVVTFVFGIVLAMLVAVFFDECLYVLGASELLRPYVSAYLEILIMVVPFILLQNIVLFFLVAAGKPNIGMIMVLIGGGANIVLDYLLIKHVGMGISGAAIATATGYFLTCSGSLLYFWRKTTLSLRLCRFDLNLSILLLICKNGASEMVNNLAAAVTTILLNYSAMQFFGEDGVAAVAIILYIDFFVLALFIGYSNGILPLISYNYGAKNSEALRRLIRICLKIVVFMGIAATLACICLSQDIVGFFVGQDEAVFTLAAEGLMIWACAFPLMGINILITVLFTGFSDGRTSAIIAFMCTGFFLVLFLLLLPKFWGIQGIWLSLPCSEIGGFLVALFYVVLLRKKYGLVQ